MIFKDSMMNTLRQGLPIEFMKKLYHYTMF